MTEKKKALDLIEKVSEFSDYETMDDKYPQKQLAIILVDEIIDALKITTGHCELRRLDLQEVQSDFDYWDRVKQEIEKL